VLGLSSSGVFLSYRREDAAPYARLLQFQLRERIPDARVFMDLDSIEPGLDFAEVIREAVDSCTVLVAFIGRQWVTLADEEGRRRLDNPDDYVRFEIQAALERGVRVIPVLVDGARSLRQEQLPVEIQKLARLNALELSYSRYEYDADRLLSLIQRVLDMATGTVHQSSSTANTAVGAVAYDYRLDENAFLAAAHEDPKAARTNPERAAQSSINESWKDSRLADVVWAVADTDLDRAERIAQSIINESERDSALVGVVRVMAATDPDRAERIAQSITRGSSKDSAHVMIAQAVTATDPDRAVRMALSMSSEASKVSALVEVAGALAGPDPDRAARLIADAERIARSITDESSKTSALMEIARALKRTDPDRAARLIADVERAAQSSTTADGFGGGR
jgi:hypothetical protein